MTKEGAAVVDVGGESIQITLFSEGGVVTTQHLVLVASQCDEPDT